MIKTFSLKKTYRLYYVDHYLSAVYSRTDSRLLIYMCQRPASTWLPNTSWKWWHYFLPSSDGPKMASTAR